MNTLLALYGIFDISNMFITTEGGKGNQRKPQDLATIETGEPAHNLVTECDISSRDFSVSRLFSIF